MEIEQILLKLQETADKAARNEGRIKKLESENAVLHQLATSVAVMAEQLKTMNKSVTTLTGKVATMESKPGKRWEWLVNNILWAIVGAAVAFMLAKIGL
jgi:hypothetical protein